MKPKTEEELQMDADMKACYDELAKYWHEISTHNEAVLKQNNIPTRHFKKLINNCDVTDKISIVEKPQGSDNKEKYGVFKSIWVAQWTVGMEGDSFEGYIYGKLDENKWLKVPYSC